MRKKINDLKDLKIARLEAKLKAAQSLQLMKQTGSDLKEDLQTVSVVGSIVKNIVAPTGWTSRQSTESWGDSDEFSKIPWDELGLDFLVQLRTKGVRWQSFIIPLSIWLIRNGYLDRLVKTKKSDVYAALLIMVRKARSGLNKK